MAEVYNRVELLVDRPFPMEGLSKGVYPKDFEPVHTWALHKSTHDEKLLARFIYVKEEVPIEEKEPVKDVEVRKEKPAKKTKGKLKRSKND